MVNCACKSVSRALGGEINAREAAAAAIFASIACL